MDTITLCHVSDNSGIWETNYAALLVGQPPAGCCIWTKKLPGLAVACISVFSVQQRLLESLQFQNQKDLHIESL